MHFGEAMLNAIKNPNLLSSWLFRAEIIAEHEGVPPWKVGHPRLPLLKGMRCERVTVRKIIPRNTQRDRALVQSCPFYGQAEPVDDDGGGGGVQKSLVLYLPHVSSASEIPFYHPQVEAVGLLHEWDARAGNGTFSVHYRLFDDVPMSERLRRTALNILSILHKLGRGQLRGYVKRVQHDLLVPQPVLQDRYSQLRDKHARRLVEGWLESTDPKKHVFEDLGIAAFLIELWATMYKPGEFPGFVDIGTGNGLLVYILNAEGFRSVRHQLASPVPHC
jgi:tRNASer (uridine44-2'-O)-methyltransferase